MTQPAPLLVDFDWETYRILPGLVAPPPVVASFTTWDGHERTQRVLLAKDALPLLRSYLLRPEVILVNQNLAWDLLASCAADSDLIPLVFDAYAQGRCRDVRLRQELMDIAAGRKQENGVTLVYDSGSGSWKRVQYHQADLEMRWFGRDRSKDKGEDSWRKRYAELDGVPLEQWPEDAIKYVGDDTNGAMDVYLAQARSLSLEWTEPVVNEVEQVRAAWCLQLISAWGLRTDKAAVDALEREVTEKFRALQERMFAEGLYRLERCTPAQVQEGKVDCYRPVSKRKKATRAQLKSMPAGAFVYEDGVAYVETQEQNIPHRYVKNTDAIRARVEAAFREQGEDAPRTEPTESSPEGNVKTDADTLGLTGDELLEELGDGGPVGTIKKTFLPTLRLGTEVPINTSFQPLLNTGRISSFKPNLNNLPREGGVRECFVPRPGFVFSSVDYSSAELRSHAQVNLWLSRKYGPWPVKMAEFFQNDPHGDPYLMLTAQILGETYEAVKARKSAGDKEVKGLRQMSKPIVLGLPGGLGVGKLIYTARKSYGVILYDGKNPKCKDPNCGWSMNDQCKSCQRSNARWLKEQWHKTYPEMACYFKYINSLLGLEGSADLEQYHPDGKPHRVRGGVGYCDGCNTYFQGLTADGAKEAMFMVAYECYCDTSSPLYGSRIISHLYDEFILEIPADIAHEAAHRQTELMIKGMQKWVPDVPIVAEPALMERWYKSAEPVYENGRLVPWRPKPKT